MARSAHDAQRSIGEPEAEAFAESYAMFAETLARLEGSYRNLEKRFDSLNHELEATNLELQDSLREKERLSRDQNEILENLGSGVLAVDADGVITLFNGAASEILAWPAQEALSLPCEEVLADGATDLRHALTSGERVRNREKMLHRRDGREVPVRFGTARMLDPEGNVVGAVETFEDISQLQQLSKQASRVGTLTALGEMAATVAHEIRNPLGGIGGFAGLLERDLEVGDSRRRLVKKIIEGVDSLNRMVTNLLNYTRPVQLNIRPADLVQVVEDSLGFFEIDAGNRLEQIELQRAYDQKELVCRIDPEQIQQMVLNLLHNAVQAMPAGGELRVGISEADAGGDERTELAGMCTVLTVRDTGVGMTEEIKSKLFMPFFTTKEDGNGLGLATAKKFVDALGGDVAVESEPDRGSVFTIYFPK